MNSSKNFKIGHEQKTYHTHALDKESRVLVYRRGSVHGFQVTIRMAISIGYAFRGGNNVGMGEHNPDRVKGDREEMVGEEGRRWCDAKRDSVSEYTS